MGIKNFLKRREEIKIKNLEKKIESSYVVEDSACPPLYYPQEVVEKVKNLVEQNPQNPKAIIDGLNTPLEASIYCTEILYKGIEEEPKKTPIDILEKREKEGRTFSEDYQRFASSLVGDIPCTFSAINEAKKGVCRHAIVAAAAILKGKIKTYNLVLKNQHDGGIHGVLVYKNQNNNFGSVGINPGDVNPPIYKSLEGLVKTINTNWGVEFKILNVLSIEKYFPDFDK